MVAADADKKLSRAVKKKQLAEESDYDKLLASAIKSEVLTKEEAVLLKDAAAARWDAIQVDAYPKSWFINNQLANKDETLNVA